MDQVFLETLLTTGRQFEDNQSESSYCDFIWQLANTKIKWYTFKRIDMSSPVQFSPTRQTTRITSRPNERCFLNISDVHLETVGVGVQFGAQIQVDYLGRRIKFALAHSHVSLVLLRFSEMECKSSRIGSLFSQDLGFNLHCLNGVEVVKTRLIPWQKLALFRIASVQNGRHSGLVD